MRLSADEIGVVHDVAVSRLCLGVGDQTGAAEKLHGLPVCLAVQDALAEVYVLLDDVWRCVPIPVGDEDGVVAVGEEDWMRFRLA